MLQQTTEKRGCPSLLPKIASSYFHYPDFDASAEAPTIASSEPRSWLKESATRDFYTEGFKCIPVHDAGL